jgi:YggT family protein
MSFDLIALFIRLIAQALIWIVIASALLSFFLTPYHPVRQSLDRIVDPFLNPIRRLVPSAGMFDFSPLILILALELISRILSSFFLSLG